MRTGLIGRRTAVLFLLLAVLACTAVGEAEWATVKHVTDGDTILLSDGRRVRYIGIDSPEIDHDGQRAEAYGIAARKANQELVSARKIRLVVDKESHDRYGRLLAYVYLPDGTLVNAELLRRGLATVLYKRPNTLLFKELLDAQRASMEQNIGLWREMDKNETVVVGNRNSRRFHLRSCPSAREIHPGNRVVFQKKWDAYWAGFSPARGCIPRSYQ